VILVAQPVQAGERKCPGGVLQLGRSHRLGRGAADPAPDRHTQQRVADQVAAVREQLLPDPKIRDPRARLVGDDEDEQHDGQRRSPASQK
jgi:hypothetical protein